jgi:Tfp pilus assembly protein PilV
MNNVRAAVAVGDSNKSSPQNDDRDAEIEEGMVDASQSQSESTANPNVSTCKFWTKKRIVAAGFSSVALVAGTVAAIRYAVSNTPPPDNLNVGNDGPDTDLQIQMTPCKNWCHSSNTSWSIICEWKNCEGVIPVQQGASIHYLETSLMKSTPLPMIGMVMI